MALPTVERTWQFKNNIAIPATGVTNTHRQVFWEIKNALTTFATNPWVCVGSSDAVTVLRYGVDALGPPGPAYDLWGATFDSSKIHWRRPDGYNSYDGGNSGRHSWIILRNTQLDTTYDICIDLYEGSNDTQAGSVRFFKLMLCRSYNLTGSGTIANRPTPDTGYAEPDLRNGNWDSYGGLGGNVSWDAWYRLQVQMSTDGLGTRIVICTGHVPTGLYIFDRIEGVPAGAPFTNPVYAVGRGPYELWTAPTYGWLHDSAVQQYDASVTGAPGTWLRYYLSCEGLGSSALPEVWNWNEVSKQWPICPIGVVQDYSPYRGRVGYLKDLWWGTAALATQFNTYPPDGSRQLMQAGHLIFPWDGGNLYTYTSGSIYQP